MMYFSDLKERGNLTILSTHRVLKDVNNLSEKEMLFEFGKYFDIKKLRGLARTIDCIERTPKAKHVFAIYTGKGKFYTLMLKKQFSAERLIKTKKTKTLKRLDVTVLHDIIIEGILGVENKEGNLKYVKNAKDAVSVVDNCDYKIAFFLRPTDVMDMKKIAERGEMMPQKSTYFYPKLLTGLTINKF